VAAAAVLEYETLLSLGALPMLAVGLIEERAKLGLPLVLFLQRRFLNPSAGLLFGVAAGMGFASFETVGYGLVELVVARKVGATDTRSQSRYPTPRTVSMLSVPKGRSSFSRR
jgi:RsiW-degrading membrane proteinase PrsW (M82 family)